MIALILLARVGLLSGALWLGSHWARRQPLAVRRFVALLSLAALILIVPVTCLVQIGVWNFHPSAPMAAYAETAAIAAPIGWNILLCLAGGVYLAGLLYWAVRFFIAVVQLQSVQTDPAPAQVEALLARLCPEPSRRPVLRLSEEITIPFSTGWGRGKIVLPAYLLEELDTRLLTAILRHELSHLAGRDPLWGFLSRLVAALFWPVPFVHVLAGQLEQVQEELADQAAIEGRPLPEKTRYAECLLTLASVPGLARPLALVARAVGRSFATMESRIRSILAENRESGATSTRCRTGMLMTAFLILALPLIFLVGLTPDGPSSRSSRSIRFQPDPSAVSLDELEQELRQGPSAASAAGALGNSDLSQDEARLRDGM